MMSVPKLRFREFVGEWEEKRLGNYLVEYKKRVSVPTELPVLTSSRLGLFFQKDYFSDRELQNNGEYGIIPRGYFTYRLMSDDSTFRFNINDLVDIGAISKEYPVFTTNGMNSYFLLQKLNYGDEFKTYAVAQKLGGTRTRLYFNKLIELKINIPTLPEQTKIANFLTAVDEKISQLTQKCDLLKQYKKGVMQQIFSQKLRFKDDDGRDFPEWEEKKLGDITHIKTGSKDLIDKVDDGPYPFYVRAQKIEKIDTYSYDGEAILIPGDGVNVGKVYHYINGKFDYHQRVYKVSNAKSAEIKYLYFYMNQYFDQHAMSFNSKASVDSLRLPIIQNFRIQLPSKLEQTKIANFLTAIDDKITQAQTQLEAVKQYKKGLLQQLFV